jgi:hypothetical protein
MMSGESENEQEVKNDRKSATDPLPFCHLNANVYSFL